MTLLLYVAFPLLCVLAIPPKPDHRSGALAERIVLGVALYEVLLLLIGVALGTAHLLTTQLYAAITWCVGIPLAVLSWRNGISLSLEPARRWLKTRRGASALLLGAMMGAVFALELGFDFIFGNRHNDGLWYHLPRVIFWLRQHSFEPWATPVWAHLGHPVGADVILGQKLLLGLGWHGACFVTSILSVGASACVYVIALDLGIKRWQAVMAAILFSSFPAIGLRIWSINSDIAAAFPVLASYVALHRIREGRYALLAFVVLIGVAVASKLTVAPHALLIGSVALWQCRRKIMEVRSFALPLAGTLFAGGIALSSHWPVYAAFRDFLAGDGGRVHKAETFRDFYYAVAMSAGHWLLEPLGYLNPIQSLDRDVIEVSRRVYNLLGEKFESLPEAWKPGPGQDIAHSGLASVALLPALFIGLPSRARMAAIFLFMAGFISLSGMLQFNPYTGRFFVLVLAGFSLLWGGTTLFARGRARWVLVGLAALNVYSLLGVVSIRSYVDATVGSAPGGAFHYLEEEDRNAIAASLKGRPLQVITNDSLDTLLVGPRIDYYLNYLTCPSDGDWVQELGDASRQSNWLALVHSGKTSVIPGPADWHRPGSSLCSEVPLQQLEKDLLSAGWKLYRRNDNVDLWTSTH